MSSLLLCLNYASYLLLTLLFLTFDAVMRLARLEAPPRKERQRDRKELTASRFCEEELEGACEFLGTCCHVPLEKLTLGHCLQLVDERIQYVARHLDEVLIPPSYFTLRETFQSWSESLCHVRETMSVVGREGPMLPTQTQPLSRPPLLSRQDSPEQPAHLHQTSAHGLDLNICQKHLQSQLGAPTLSTESLAQVFPSTPAQFRLAGDSTVIFDMSRVPLLGSTEWDKLDHPVRTKRIPEEQDTALQRFPTALLPSAPQSKAPGEPMLGERHAERLWDLLPHQATRGFSAQLPTPSRVTSEPTCTQENQEAYGYPVESRLPKARIVVPAPDTNPAMHVPMVAAKFQGHVAQKCLEIQMKAFPRLMSESHGNTPFLKETSPAKPPQSYEDLGEDSMTAFPARGKYPSQTVSYPVSQWELPSLDPEPPAKLPPPIPAQGGGAELGETESNFQLDKTWETLDRHVLQKKLQQEWGWPDAPRKALGACQTPVPKPCTLKPHIKVVSSLGELRFLVSDVKKRLEFHILKMQVQKRWGLPQTVQDSLKEFMSPAPEQRGWLSPTRSSSVVPYHSPFPVHSRKAQSSHVSPRDPSESWIQDLHALPTDTRQKLGWYYSPKCSGELKGEESPDHRQAWQTKKQSAVSSGSERSPTPEQDAAMETDGSDGAAGSWANSQPCDLLVGADVTLLPPGPERTEQTQAATLHIDQREDGTNGSKEKVELHLERKVVSGEGLKLEEWAGEDGAALPSSQDLQVAPEAPGCGQLTDSIIDTLVAGQIAHDQELKRLMGMLSSASPWADHVSTGHSVCPHPGVTKTQKSQETQVSGEFLGLRDTAAPNGLSGNGPSEVSRDQPPGRVCEKCSKRRERRRAGLAGADSPKRSHGIPQRETLGNLCASDYHSMPVVWLLPVGNSKRHDGKGKKTSSKLPIMVSTATSTTGLSQTGFKRAGSPEGSPPQASRPRIQSPSRNKVPVLKQIFMCLKQTLSKLQSKVTSRMSHDARPKTPDIKFTKPPFWRRRTSKGVRFPYY
ncbi:uncharacterized protein LOC142831285 [Pelodiscus sinensis]|uniref:uncharacterized protein LOC142831285 n=1 Tax=Pelodiscus sinensis TaxID=13735 RepID=UPI003F6D6547